METRKVNFSEDEIRKLNSDIDAMTRVMVEKLDELKPDTNWFPIMVYSVFNVLDVVCEMVRRGGGNAELKDMAETFSNELKNAAKGGSMLTFTDTSVN